MNKYKNSESQESVLGVVIISVGCVVISICLLFFYRLNIALFWSTLGYILSSLVVSSKNQTGISRYKVVKLSNAMVGILSLCLIGYGLFINESTNNKKPELTVDSEIHAKK
jgi:predicted benzoate:H+ symporter BenE